MSFTTSDKLNAQTAVRTYLSCPLFISWRARLEIVITRFYETEVVNLHLTLDLIFVCTYTMRFNTATSVITFVNNKILLNSHSSFTTS